MSLHIFSTFEDVSCSRRQHLYWRFMILSDLQQTYGLVLQKLVQLQLTLISTATSFVDTFVAGLDEEKYFTVHFNLVGCKRYITST